MPKQKKFKERVRARQERDGVSYSEARRIEHQVPEWPWQLDPGTGAFDFTEQVPQGALWLYEKPCRTNVFGFREGTATRVLPSKTVRRPEGDDWAAFRVPELDPKDPPNEDTIARFLRWAQDEGLRTLLVCSAQRRGILAYDDGGVPWGSLKAALSAEQEQEQRRESTLDRWLQDNPGPHEVRLKLDYNEHGVPQVFVRVHEGEGPPVTFTVTQAPTPYKEAIRRGVEDAKWARAPRDDL